MSLENEVLGTVRNGTMSETLVAGVTEILKIFLGKKGYLTGKLISDIADGLSYNVEQGQIWANNQLNSSDKTVSTTGWTDADTRDRHSYATLIIVQYLTELEKNQVGERFSYWHNQEVLNSFLWSIYENDLSKEVLFSKATLAKSAEGLFANTGEYYSILQTAIAYSALDSGERPYGDTGIRVLFNELNDIGFIYDQKNKDSFLDKSLFYLDIDKTRPVIAASFVTDLWLPT